MGDININGNQNTVVVGQRKGIGFFGFIGLILLVGWLIKHILIVLAILAFAGVVCAVAWAVMWDERQREAEIHKRQAIAARADAQHRAIVLDGDLETGTYGDFPPAV